MTARKKSSSDASDITKKIVGKTAKDKELIIDQTTTGLFFIKFNTGGQLPKELSGRYTKYEYATDAIAVYLRGK